MFGECINLFSLRPYIVIIVSDEQTQLPLYNNNTVVVIIIIIVFEVQNWIAKEFTVPTTSCGKLFSILGVWNHCCNYVTWSFSYSETSLQNSPSFFLLLQFEHVF